MDRIRAEVDTGQMVDGRPFILVPTPSGILHVSAVQIDGQTLVVATSAVIPTIPVVRFQSSCIFGEALHALDCDCGAQLDAAVSLIIKDGGILVYAWEEGRGAGIEDKIRAISLQQGRGVSTTEAFSMLGLRADPRTFNPHIAALRRVFSGDRIRFTSSNPGKLAALRDAGFVVERERLQIVMTPERSAYLAHKREHLGHLDDH